MESRSSPSSRTTPQAVGGDAAGSPLAAPAAASPETSPVICVAEDRQSCEPAVRLLVASLYDHCPGVRVELFVPDPTPPFRRWLARFPDVALNDHRVPGDWQKYDVKPQALLTLLERGHTNVMWMDSDILVCRDFRPLFAGIDAGTLVVTEEALCSTHSDEDGLRTRLWDLPPGRALPFTANSALVRVTTAHRGLLERWRSLLGDTRYKDAQRIQWRSRPPHLLGDQDVLTAVLGSAEFAHVPLKYLRRGTDILQYFGSYGYTLAERLGNMRHGMPAFVHSQGTRPWWPRSAANGAYMKFNSLYLELSPYTLMARKYRRELETDDWMEPSSWMVSALRTLGANRPQLVGLPLAALADAVRPVKRILRF